MTIRELRRTCNHGRRAQHYHLPSVWMNHLALTWARTRADFALTAPLKLPKCVHCHVWNGRTCIRYAGVYQHDTWSCSDVIACDTRHGDYAFASCSSAHLNAENQKSTFYKMSVKLLTVIQSIFICALCAHLSLHAVVATLPDYVHVHSATELRESDFVMLNKPHLCDAHPDKNLIIAIKTSPKNSEQRDLIRNSWLGVSAATINAMCWTGHVLVTFRA